MYRVRLRTAWVLTAVLFGLAAAASACGGGGGAPRNTGIIVRVATPTEAPGPTARPVATLPPTPFLTPSPTPSPTPLQVCGPNPDAAPPSLLQVESPAPESKVKSLIQVSGWGSTIGKGNIGVAVALVDTSGTPVTVLNVPPQPTEFRAPPGGLDITDDTAPFAADLVPPAVGADTPFCIWVYVSTTAEGVAQDVVQIPVIVTP